MSLICQILTICLAHSVLSMRVAVLLRFSGQGNSHKALCKQIERNSNRQCLFNDKFEFESSANYSKSQSTTIERRWRVEFASFAFEESLNFVSKLLASKQVKKEGTQLRRTRRSASVDCFEFWTLI